MKKLIFAFVLTSALVSCEKESSTPNTNNNPLTDTTNNASSSSVVNSIDCASIQLTGTLKKGEVANSVSVNINYSGGNGKAYDSQTISSTGVSGLSAKRAAGVLVNGNGSLSYVISGAPTIAGVASFSITLGGKSCNFSLTIEDDNQSGIIAGENIKDIEDNSYKTVHIGGQHWMAENLRVTKFNDGTLIPQAIASSAWVNADVPARCYYDNNNAKYGILYNWLVADGNNKNVCPTGWHVARDIEWTELTNYLGGEQIAGGKLKEVGFANWESPNTDASNSALFNALPGGLRTADGDFYRIKNRAYWWSPSSEISVYGAKYRKIKFDSGNIEWSYEPVRAGMSIRCLKN